MECKKDQHDFVEIAHDGVECTVCGAAIVTGWGYHADGTGCDADDLRSLE